MEDPGRLFGAIARIGVCRSADFGPLGFQHHGFHSEFYRATIAKRGSVFVARRGATLSAPLPPRLPSHLHLEAPGVSIGFDFDRSESILRERAEPSHFPSAPFVGFEEFPTELLPFCPELYVIQPFFFRGILRPRFFSSSICFRVSLGLDWFGDLKP